MMQSISRQVRYRLITNMPLFMIVACILLYTVPVLADTYGAFKTTRYFSNNRLYFVVVSPKKIATLYQNNRRKKKVLWTQNLSELPANVLVTNDGSRTLLIEHYFGNRNSASAKVVQVLNETGSELKSYRLSEVANISKVIKTTSSTQWYSKAYLEEDGDFLVIETVIAKRDPIMCKQVDSFEEADECSTSVPYEQLRFATKNGDLVSRTKR